jgi:ATP phosphoribosyltransferase regulatory subunit
MRSFDLPMETDLPKGVKDFLPLKAAKADFLQQQLRQVFAAWGFRPVITPQLEYLDVLERGLGEGLRDRAFRFDDRQSGRLVAFPPDMTPQIARIAATRMRERPLPLRLSYSGRVLRHTEQQVGKDRDIFQTGVELIGLDNPEADAEMIAMAVEALQAVGAENFTIDIGQVDFFRGVMDGLSLDDRMADQVADAILRKDNSELQALLKETDLNKSACQEVLALPRLFGGREVLERAEKVVRNERSRKALENLAQVLDVLAIYDLLEYVTVDLGELRGLNYHTGITFQGSLPGVGRAVCSGGRYNNLTGKYGFDAPATGFTFSLLHLLFALDKSLDRQVDSSTDLLVFASGSHLLPAQRLARKLRQQGYSVARDILPREQDAALEYARLMNFKYMAIVAGEEDDVELICLKDDQSRQVPWQQAIKDGFKI